MGGEGRGSGRVVCCIEQYGSAVAEAYQIESAGPVNFGKPRAYGFFWDFDSQVLEFFEQSDCRCGICVLVVAGES